LGAALGATGFVVARRAVHEELADQVFQLQRRLRQHELIAVGQERRGAAGLDRNILATDQTACEHRSGRVIRYLGVALVDRKGHGSFDSTRLDHHRIDAADGHAGHFHRGARLQAADVGEITRDMEGSAQAIRGAAATEELADHLFQLLRRAGKGERPTLLHRVLRLAVLQADVLVAQQAAGVDGGHRVIGDVLAGIVDGQGHLRFFLARHQVDRGDRADAHAGHFHRGTHLQLADVGEAGFHVVRGTAVLIGDGGGLGGQVGQRGKAKHDEQAGADGIGTSLGHGTVLEWNTERVAVMVGLRGLRSGRR
jgi:hypothetical protein